MEYIIPDVSTLRRIRSLSELGDDQMVALANQLQVLTAHKGDLLLERGSKEEASLYVLTGKISLTAADGHTKHLSICESDELNPIAQLRPCIYDIQAQETIQYLKMQKQKLVEFAQMSEMAAGDISVHSLHSSDSDSTQLVINDLYRNIMRNQVEIPTLPTAAIEIGTLFREQSGNQHKLSQILLSYPEVSRKLIKKENVKAPSDRRDLTAIMKNIATRLGVESAYYLIMTHVVNRLFYRPPPELTKKLSTYQEHSINVAAACRVLAKDVRNINPDKAMLAGISHNIGVIVILDFLLKHGSFALDSEEIEFAVDAVRPEFTNLLLSRWQFPEDIVDGAQGCDDWFRNPRDKIDLSDILLVANYHCLMMTDKAPNLPPISSIPAMKKLEISQEKSIALVKNAANERRKIEKLISS